MKLSDLIRYAEAALHSFGDLDCYIDSDDDDDCCSLINELVMETTEEGDKHILLTAYDFGQTTLYAVK